MIKCLIVDDEHAAVEILSTFIEQTPFLTLTHATTNPIEAIGVVQNQSIDLTFLDIQMPQISGLDFMKIVQGKTKFVLTTAYSQFALDGYELDAIDYLMKPIAYERFLKAVQKMMNLTTGGSSQVWKNPVAEIEDYIFVKTENKGKMVRINFKDITYIEGLKNYIAIHTKDEQIVTLMNMKDLEERLPTENFMRVHKSYIICTDRIKLIDGNQISLADVKGYVPLGESYRNIFFDTIDNKVMGGKNK
ncbi:MAG: LytTR family DNA-binding domain-containing protein [Arcicella sp.]|jgi:DNA-binding LytR/AlgR family response regulator|nr:LytTR family DNA-binding domain-containing protein [Arcicella sp.]